MKRRPEFPPQILSSKISKILSTESTRCCTTYIYIFIIIVNLFTYNNITQLLLIISSLSLSLI